MIGLPPVLNFGSNEMKAKVVPEVLSGRKFICLAVCVSTPFVSVRFIYGYNRFQRRMQAVTCSGCRRLPRKPKTAVTGSSMVTKSGSRTERE